MSCAKQTVVAVIVTNDNQLYMGQNSCRFPQRVCPRKENDDYKMCKDVFDQFGHAEELAIKAATDCKADLKGASLYLFGHVGPCEKCLELINKHKINWVSMTPDIATNRPPWAQGRLGSH